ncbi:DUF2249 domain-containing protein [Acidithrix ferrooxidans]|uniref:DUF2249 domain-containing protein n=1 Tax=Acidithrix ferrooxidans TaxID=1280514 RepID=A0A0D8HHT8_9ACTN|nr:DUF2249 domain-containing protein [Acidithrix ferrooxidans]KJF16646.1 hypothetical protein AXFE_25090 [Acidithrix ferrooxidans]
MANGDPNLDLLVPSLSGVVIDLSKALAKSGEPRLAATLLSRAWVELYRSGEFAKQAKAMEATMHSISRLDHSDVDRGGMDLKRPDGHEADSQPVDLRPLAPIDRHAEVISRFEALADGDEFVLVNDHDPKPLYYQLKAEYDKVFDWDYLKGGPEEWIVKITISPGQQSRDQEDQC